jgi:von Willebrand factor type A domain-containing protein
MPQEFAQKVKGVVDIVFLVDVTGSMQHCIDALRENISAFIDTLTTKSANNDSPVEHWRAKVVGFRDYKVDKEPFVDNPFVEDDTTLRQQLNGLSAEGGGDEPESLLDAIYKVTTMPSTDKMVQSYDPYKWRYRSQAARVVVAFTDASYHLVMSEPSGGTVDEVINALYTNRIILSLFAPEMACHDKLGEADKSEYTAIPWNASSKTGAQEALANFTSDQSNFQKTMQMLARSISATAGTETL